MTSPPVNGNMENAHMSLQLPERQTLNLIMTVVLAITLFLLFLYVRQRLFTQTEPIVLAT